MPKARDPELRGIFRKHKKLWYKRELKPSLRERFGRRNITVPLHCETWPEAIKKAKVVRREVEAMIAQEVNVTDLASDPERNKAALDSLALKMKSEMGEGTGDPYFGALDDILEKLERVAGESVARYLSEGAAFETGWTECLGTIKGPIRTDAESANNPNLFANLRGGSD